MEVNYNKIFELGILEYHIKNLNTQYLIDQAYKIKSKDNSKTTKSNENGYQSPSNLHLNPNFSLLTKNLNSLFQTHLKPLDQKIKAMWVNISPPCSLNWPHDHGKVPDDSITGVIYLKVPKNSGSILFHNPYDNNVVLYQKEYKEKTLILFPCSLIHSVNINRSNEDRISIAFNFGHYE
jgi:hypothetical protein